MKTDLLKRLDEIENKQRRKDAPNGLPVFYATLHAKADELFYPV